MNEATQAKLITMSLTALRVVSGLLLMQAGGMKLFGWLGGMPGGVPAPTFTSQMGIGALLEVIGGPLLMIGLLTRPTAFLLSGMMAVAYFQFHQPGGTWPAQNGGVPAVLMCFIYLFFAAYGAGPWSLDALLARRKV